MVLERTLIGFVGQSTLAEFSELHRLDTPSGSHFTRSIATINTQWDSGLDVLLIPRRPNGFGYEDPAAW